jgi:hypothetical protein
MATTAKTIFPNILDANNITATFEVNDSVGILRIDGWIEGDKLMLETLVGNECDNRWIPVTFCCNTVSTSAPSTHMLFPIPGRYRAVLFNKDDLHITDTSHFEDVRIYFEEHPIKTDISAYFQLCC